MMSEAKHTWLLEVRPGAQLLRWQPLGELGSPRRGGLRTPGHAHDLHDPVQRSVVQVSEDGGDQLAGREVAGCPEDDDLSGGS